MWVLLGHMVPTPMHVGATMVELSAIVVNFLMVVAISVLPG